MGVVAGLQSLIQTSGVLVRIEVVCGQLSVKDGVHTKRLTPKCKPSLLFLS